MTVRVPGDLRRRMRRIKQVNWSEVARKAFEERVDLEMSKESRDWTQIAEATKSIDENFDAVRKKYGKLNCDSAVTVGICRDTRYSSSYQTPL